MGEKRKKTIFSRKNCISLASSLACFLVLGTIFIGLTRHNLESARENYRYIAKNEAEHIATTIDCVIARTNTLKALIQDNNGSTAFFDDAAEIIYDEVLDETGVALKNFALAPGGVVSNVYPLEGNENLLGFDFLDPTHPGNAEAKSAYELGGTVLTNPFELIQGGTGMGGRAPVILRDGYQRNLWGLVTVTIDYDNLLEVLNLDNLAGMGVNYALSYIDGDGERRIMHSGGRLDRHSVKTQFKVRNLTWELEVSPKRGWISILHIALFTIIFLIISGFAGLFTRILLKLRETNEILLRLSNTDLLTGGLNRTSYETALAELAGKPIDDDFVYVAVDLNGLKPVNDSFGHLAGDELISGASKCLNDAFRGFGKVYRVGGDEFAALIHTESQSFDLLMDKLDSLTKEWRGVYSEELSLSVGQASHREFSDADMEKLIKTADTRMYEEKRSYYQSKGFER